MKYSRTSVRRTITSALALVALLNVPAPTYNSHQSSSTAAISPINSQAAVPDAPPVAYRQARASASEAYGKLPLRFEANDGQTDEQVRFLSRGSGYDLFLTPTEAVLAMKATHRQSIVRMKLVGAALEPRVEGVDVLPGMSNYLIGNDPDKWRRKVKNYAKVRCQSVYRGIDLIYYGNQQQLEYDFVVAPGADPSAIRLDFDGVERIEMDARGDLILHTGGGAIVQRRPVVYQEIDGHRQEVASRYVVANEREIGFDLASYDCARPLVIDPVLAYSTYLGGGDYDKAYDIAVDASGNAYVTGYASSLDFPTANPLQSTNAGVINVFIAKLNAEGSALVYSTYLGGNDVDIARDIAVDWEGNACLVGDTSSADFPTKNPLQPIHAGPFVEAFVAKLSADGSDLVYSTYLGGSRNDYPEGIAADDEGNVYVTGQTDSTDFPTRNALQPVFGGSDHDAFVTKLSADGSELVYSTFLGGSDSDFANDIVVDAFGNAYVVGNTSSIDFPTANPFQSSLRGYSNAFVTKLDAAGTTLVYSTYLGGSLVDGARAIAVDTEGNAYLTGLTFSTDFPTVNPIQSSPPGKDDIFVSKLDPSGSVLVYSTYLGGTGYEYANGIAVDSQGNAYIAGETGSTDFPTLDALQPMPVDSAPFTNNIFVTKLNAAGSGLVYSTYLGGNGDDGGHGIAVDASDDVYVAGYTASADLITTPGALQNQLRSPGDFYNSDAFIIKITNAIP